MVEFRKIKPSRFFLGLLIYSPFILAALIPIEYEYFHNVLDKFFHWALFVLGAYILIAPLCLLFKKK